MCIYVCIYIYIYLRGKPPIWKKTLIGLIKAGILVYFNNFACLWGCICRIFSKKCMPGTCFLRFGCLCVAQGCMQQGKNKGAECAVRASIWTSIGCGFWSFSLPGVFSKAVSSQCAATKVLSVFVQVFFSFLGQPT